MAFRNILYIDAESTLADIDGNAIKLHGNAMLGVEAVWAGSTPSGTLKLQGSFDYDDRKQTGTWYDIANGTFGTSPAGSDSSTSESFTGIGCPYVRVKYARSSGGAAGGMTVRVCIKER